MRPIFEGYFLPFTPSNMDDFWTNTLNLHWCFREFDDNFKFDQNMFFEKVDVYVF